MTIEVVPRICIDIVPHEYQTMFTKDDLLGLKVTNEQVQVVIILTRSDAESTANSLLDTASKLKYKELIDTDKEELI